MRIFHINGDPFAELEALPDVVPVGGYLWRASARCDRELLRLRSRDVPERIEQMLAHACASAN
jgi:hypothetical protein